MGGPFDYFNLGFNDFTDVLLVLKLESDLIKYADEEEIDIDKGSPRAESKEPYWDEEGWLVIPYDGDDGEEMISGEEPDWRDAYFDAYEGRCPECMNDPCTCYGWSEWKQSKKDKEEDSL